MKAVTFIDWLRNIDTRLAENIGFQRHPLMKAPPPPPPAANQKNLLRQAMQMTHVANPMDLIDVEYGHEQLRRMGFDEEFINQLVQQRILGPRATIGKGKGYVFNAQLLKAL